MNKAFLKDMLIPYSSQNGFIYLSKHRNWMGSGICNQFF